MALSHEDIHKIREIFRNALQEQFQGLSECIFDSQSKILIEIRRVSRRMDQLPTRREVDELHERIRRLESSQKNVRSTTVN